MKVFLAGVSVSNPTEDNPIVDLHKMGCKLPSFYHAADDSFFEYKRPGLLQHEKPWLEVNMKNKVDLFLDSGAYSAFTQGVEIDIQEYIAFVKKHQDVIKVYANLDVIGDAKGTWRNQLTMEKSGLKPVPVFHQGEPEKYLKKYMEKYDYICLGGMVGSSSPALALWLDRMFLDYLIDENGFPKIKVHGFGLTSLRLMLRYPWYSVDSTSWVMTGRMGSIYVPRYRNGQWIYDEESWKVAVSLKSPSAKEAGKHINTLTPGQKQIILDYIHSKGYKLGKSSFKTESQDYQLREGERWGEKKPKDKSAKRQVEIIEEDGICNRYQLRDEMNIIYFLDLEKSMPEWPWPFDPKETVKNPGLGLI